MRPDFLALSSLEICQNSFLTIKVQNGSRGCLEHLQPVPHRFRLVILSLYKVLTSLIILSSNLKNRLVILIG